MLTPAAFLCARGLGNVPILFVMFHRKLHNDCRQSHVSSSSGWMDVGAIREGGNSGRKTLT